jgi:hypothetical protein
MKAYPSIQGPTKAPRKPCIAFRKYDGSNLRFEWSKKRGWHKYGTRRRLFDESDEKYGAAIPLFLASIGPAVEAVIAANKKSRAAKTIIAFCEFFGPLSFAGQHKPGDDMQLRLIDVNVHKRGIVSPRDFVNEFGHLPEVAEVVREGNLTDEFVREVRAGMHVEGGVQPFPEGVVCKGGSGHKLWMAKIKTDAYKEELKRVFEGGWEEYWE